MEILVFETKEEARKALVGQQGIELKVNTEPLGAHIEYTYELNFISDWDNDYVKLSNLVKAIKRELQEKNMPAIFYIVKEQDDKTYSPFNEREIEEFKRLYGSE